MYGHTHTRIYNQTNIHFSCEMLKKEFSIQVEITTFLSLL